MKIRPFLPLRWVAIQPQHFVGLGHEVGDTDTDTPKFYIGEYNGVSGVACMMGPFASLAAARKEFEFYAADHAAAELVRLEQRIRDRAAGKLPFDPTLADSLEWFRLKMLDDPKFYTQRAQAREFCATHTRAEIEEADRKTLKDLEDRRIGYLVDEADEHLARTDDDNFVMPGRRRDRKTWREETLAAVRALPDLKRRLFIERYEETDDLSDDEFLLHYEFLDAELNVIRDNHRRPVQ